MRIFLRQDDEIIVKFKFECLKRFYFEQIQSNQLFEVNNLYA